MLDSFLSWTKAGIHTESGDLTTQTVAGAQNGYTDLLGKLCLSPSSTNQLLLPFQVIIKSHHVSGCVYIVRFNLCPRNPDFLVREPTPFSLSLYVSDKRLRLPCHSKT